MATCAFITKFSRRAILLAGGGVIVAPSFAAPPPDPHPDPDAELLRRMALAERRRAEYAATQAACARSFDALVNHPDYPDMANLGEVTDAVRAGWAGIAAQTGHRIAAEAAGRAHDRFEAAANAAFALPARTPRGLCAKMRLAVAAARDGDYGNREDHGWLTLALADLERLAAGA